MSTRFLANADRFTAIVGSISDWSAPSACEGWTAQEVFDHVIDSERDMLTQHGADLGDRPSGSPVEVWAAHFGAAEPYVRDDAWMAKEYDGWFGPTTVGATVTSFLGIDLVMHGWDIATSSGSAYPLTDAELDQAQEFIDTMGQALYMEGVCKQPLDVSPDASRQVKVLALAGRST